jgi:hypothetical protein
MGLSILSRISVCLSRIVSRSAGIERGDSLGPDIVPPDAGEDGWRVTPGEDMGDDDGFDPLFKTLD